MERSEKQLPKYARLKAELLSWLESGRLKPGDRMPSENEVASRFGFSRQTVRQTFGELEKEGWLQRIQGKGTFVSTRPPSEDGGGHDAPTVGMLTTYISDYIFPHIVRGAESELRSSGYAMLLASTDNSKEKERESLRTITGRSLSGLIVEPTKSAEGNPNIGYYLQLEYGRIPYVMINARYPDLECPYVIVDDEAGTFAATDHLIRLGHRHLVGFFKTDDLQGVHRLRGFVRAHRENGLPLPPDAVVTYRTEEKETAPAEAAAAMLKQGKRRPTAFVCYNDELAVRLLETIRRSGLSVPGDVSVVGFDDAVLATATEVKLTTLTHPKAELGACAARLLLSLIKGEPAEPVVFRPELIVRESTAPPQPFPQP
jgi:GntR family transcriptional regulator of arabinose operon